MAENFIFNVKILELHGMHITTTLRFCLIQVGIAEIKIKKATNTSMGVGKREHSVTLSGNTNLCNCYGHQWGGS